MLPSASSAGEGEEHDEGTKKNNSGSPLARAGRLMPVGKPIRVYEGMAGQRSSTDSSNFTAGHPVRSEHGQATKDGGMLGVRLPPI